MKFKDARGIIIEELKALAEEEYRLFNTRVIATVPLERVIGVKTDGQRKIAKKYAGTEIGETFMSKLPHQYFEENQVHGFMIEQIKDRGRVMAELERFLPTVDNWATCDCVSPKIFKKQPPTLEDITKWMNDDRTYICRFGMGMLMRYYLDDRFEPSQLNQIIDFPWQQFQKKEKDKSKSTAKSTEKAAIKTTDIVKIPQGTDVYYINMMRAWYFATALAKQYEAALPIIESGKLDKWTHNKAIQKACESYRVSPEHKAYLKSLKK